MLKKSLYAAGALALLAGLVFGTDAWSYVTTGAGKVRDSVKSIVSLEFELDRARKMVDELTPTIADNRHRIAEETVQVEKLEQRIAALEDRQSEERGEVLTLKHDLEREQDAYTYGRRVYTVAEVKADLARRFERYQSNEKQLDVLRSMHKARKQTLAGAEQKLQNMLHKQQELKVAIESLQARLEMVRAAEAASEFTFDDSQLARVKQLVDDLETQIEVKARLADQEADAYAEIPVSAGASSSEDIVDQVTAYFEADPEQIVIGH